jgi:hypothetical protein
MASLVLTLSLPVELAHELDAANQEFLFEVLERGLRSVKIDRVLERYARGGMSFGAAAHWAGVTEADLVRHAYSRGMEPPHSLETLAEELS